jgi:hypothetical protein
MHSHECTGLNLLCRALVFVAKFFDSKVPAATAKGQEAADGTITTHMRSLKCTQCNLQGAGVCGKVL